MGNDIWQNLPNYPAARLLACLRGRRVSGRQLPWLTAAEIAGGKVLETCMYTGRLWRTQTNINLQLSVLHLAENISSLLMSEDLSKLLNKYFGVQYKVNGAYATWPNQKSGLIASAFNVWKKKFRYHSAYLMDRAYAHLW